MTPSGSTASPRARRRSRYAFYAAATGEPGYIEVAERAVEFLVRDWHDDGRPYIWPFDWYYPRLSLLHAGARHRRAVLHPGRHRRGRVDQPQRDGAPACLRGAAPLSARQPGADRDLGRGAWWPIQDTWNNSKSAATPLFLAYFLRVAPQFGLPPAELAQVEETYAVARRFLCTPAHARQIGVMESDPDLPWGGHSLMSWTGCAVAATGFAGLALADMVKPGISYLA